MKKLILIALSLLVVPAAFAANAAAQPAAADQKEGAAKQAEGQAAESTGFTDSVKKQYNKAVDAVYPKYAKHTFAFPAAFILVGMLLAKPVVSLYNKLFKSEEAVQEETLAERQRRSAASAQAKSDALLAQRLAAQEYAAANPTKRSK